MADTSLLNVVAFHATAETSAPTLAAAGANITQAVWNAAGYTTCGKVDEIGNDIDLDEDTVSPEWIKEFETIRAPRGNAPEDKILLSHRVESFEVIMYGIPESLFALDSNAAIASNVFGTTTTTTKRTCCLEVGGISLLVIPKCIVTVNLSQVGYASGGVARAKVLIDPLKNATHDTGAYLEWYQ